MKKIICLLFAIVFACASLFACADGGKAESDKAETTTAENRPSYAGKGIDDYDANGNFILTSTDDRAVYSYDSGYVVFTFAGETVKKVQRVLVFEDSAAAQEFVSEQAKAAVEAGGVPQNMTVNGSLVICAVGFSNNEGTLGSYYLKSRTDVVNDFTGKEA